MPKFGTVMSAKPRMTVLRGFDPNQPFSKTFAAPVKEEEKDLLKSGMVISLVYNAVTGQDEWNRGWAVGRNVYWALQDGNDYDVESANSLVGYSCLGDFVLQTAYFVSNSSYPVGTPLTPVIGTDGNVDATTAGAGTAIVGYITQPVTDLKAGGATGYPSVSAVLDGNVITFQTAWLPANAND